MAFWTREPETVPAPDPPQPTSEQDRLLAELHSLQSELSGINLQISDLKKASFRATPKGSLVLAVGSFGEATRIRDEMAQLERKRSRLQSRIGETMAAWSAEKCKTG
jgi:hypothetical protein